MKSSQLEAFFIQGAAGKLETVLAKPDGTPKGIAIVAHPHPLYGGTMDNKVIYTLFKTFLELGFITVKFNFRGVGQSEGNFAEGIGELEDVLTVTEEIRKRLIEYQNLPLLLSGFSFGGGIQLHAAQKLNPEYLILVAPSIVHLKAPMPPKENCFVLIIQGEQDDVVTPESILAWARPQSQPIVLLPGAEHFFHGKLMTIKDLIVNFFSPKI
ncbi:MAG TPA: alpha/beta hydrolase [Nitrosomonas sp.]|nr:alpha/beta hydrolase [Nitrosomonas sp.]HQX13595.1 alpha/beta hydrolase [Nitrosomonas sp.]HRB20419.1 alpha/beta hydrolase [Nitrosomonas sp.]HRB32981.1 alpha/beta hydrolase [Nitrosomonas sp.]HRB45642.1 alpha/beta hydrolase [Nitrosomonas sp.]